jgi:hypothetical protein
MQGVRVIRIRRKRLLAANLGIEISSGSQMTEAGVAERSRCACAWTIRIYLGCSGGCPAVATVHQRISGGPSANL